MSVRVFLALLLLPPVLLSACRSTTAPGLALSSSPPGARVLVDGQDSGFVTPCLIAVEEASVVRFELSGYEPEEVAFHKSTVTDAVPWSEGDLSQFQQTTFRFPLWLPLWDLGVPFQIDKTLQPGRVHVKLRLALGF